MKTGLLLSTFILMTHYICGQVYTLKKNDYYGQLSFSTSTFSKAYDSTGKIIELSPFIIQDFTAQLKLIYGLSERITISLTLPFAVQSSILDENHDSTENALLSESEGQLSYPGNAEGGIVYKLRNDNPFISASLFIENNTNDHSFITGLSSGYNAWSFRPGGGLKGTYNKFWYMAYAAADLKTNNFSSGLISMLELGYKPLKEFYFAVNYTGRASFENGSYCNCNIVPTGLFFNDQSYAAISIKPGFIFNSLGLNFGYTTALYGKNIPGEAVFTVGFSYTKN